MRLIGLLLAVVLAVGAAAADELPSLKTGEILIRTAPPTTADFEQLQTFGPLWTDAVAGYYGVPKKALPPAKLYGYRAQVWGGIEKLRAIDVPKQTGSTDLTKIYDFAKAKSPEIGLLSEDEVARMILLGQSINADNYRMTGDENKLCIWFFTCGPPPPPKQPPPKKAGDVSIFLPAPGGLGSVPDYRITVPPLSKR